MRLYLARFSIGSGVHAHHYSEVGTDPIGLAWFVLTGCPGATRCDVVEAAFDPPSGVLIPGPFAPKAYTRKSPEIAERAERIAVLRREAGNPSRHVEARTAYGEMADKLDCGASAGEA